VFGAVSQIKELQIFPVLPPALPGAGNYDVELVLKGPGTPEQMADYAGQLVGAAFGSGKFMFADTDLKIDLPQVRVSVNRERVADLGLDLAEVGQQLGILLAGNYVNRFTLDGRAYKVIPQVGSDSRSVAQNLLNYKIRLADGSQIPVSAIASLETFTAPRTLARFQQADSFRVFGGVNPGVTKADGLATLEAAARQILPAGYTIDYAGESRQLRQEGTDLSGAGRAVRQFPRSARGSARLGSAGAYGRALVHVPQLHDDQHLQPDRPDHACRADCEERHSDRILRQ
jgi:multidrug efflux pump